MTFIISNHYVERVMNTGKWGRDTESKLLIGFPQVEEWHWSDMKGHGWLALPWTWPWCFLNCWAMNIIPTICQYGIMLHRLQLTTWICYWSYSRRTIIFWIVTSSILTWINMLSLVSSYHISSLDPAQSAARQMPLCQAKRPAASPHYIHDIFMSPTVL